MGTTLHSLQTTPQRTYLTRSVIFTFIFTFIFILNVPLELLGDSEVWLGCISIHTSCCISC